MNCKCPKCNNVLEYQPSEPEIGIANPYFGCEECDGMGEVKIEDDEE